MRGGGGGEGGEGGTFLSSFHVLLILYYRPEHPTGALCADNTSFLRGKPCPCDLSGTVQIVGILLLACVPCTLTMIFKSRKHNTGMAPPPSKPPERGADGISGLVQTDGAAFRLGPAKDDEPETYIHTYMTCIWNSNTFRNNNRYMYFW